MSVLRLGGGNIYVGNRKPREAIDYALSQRPHSWGWSEMGTDARNARDAGKEHGYRTLSAFGFEDMRDANDCIMHIRQGLNIRHFSMTQVCDDAQPEKLAHDRTFSMLAFEAPFLSPDSVVCHIAIHPNWITGVESPTSPIARQYVRSVKGLDAMLDFAGDMGWIRAVTGDFNSRQGQSKRFPTVYDVLGDHRLQVKTEGIDAIAWDRALRLEDWKIVPKARTGSDHPWLLAEFSRSGHLNAR